MKKITVKVKEELFCKEFIVDLNATAAYKRISPNTKANTAQVQAARYLRRPHIKERIQELMTERSEKTQITAEKVLGELYKIAMADIGEAFNDDGSLKKIKDMPEALRKAVSSVKILEYFEGHGEEREQVGFIKDLKFWDKNRSLENLGRHLKLFTDIQKSEGEVEHTVKVNAVDITDRIEQLKKK